MTSESITQALYYSKALSRGLLFKTNQVNSASGLGACLCCEHRFLWFIRKAGRIAHHTVVDMSVWMTTFKA